MHRILLALLGSLLLLAAPAPAQTAADTTATVRAEQAVPVPRPTARAVRYHRTGNALWLVAQGWALLIPLALLFTGFSARMRDLAQRVGRRWFLVVAVYGILFTLLTWAIDLPFAYYTSFVRPHEYGLSNQAFSKWQADQLRGLALGLAAVAATLWIPYLLLRRSPRRWWLYTSLAFIPLLVFVALIQPVFVDPMFNTFGPVKDRALEQELLALADRAGIDGARVYEVEKSVDTNTLNAYVAGVGGTKRIVLWDTLVRRLDRREVLFVMGHEMGHFVLGHTLLRLVLGALLILLSLYAVHRTSGWIIARFHRRLGFTELSDVASLPLLLVLTSLVGLATTPAVNVFTRWGEREADRFGLELTRDNAAAARAFVKLQSSSLAVPYPGTFYKLFRSSHPALGERIEFANRYRPWETGQPLRYGDRFQD